MAWNRSALAGRGPFVANLNSGAVPIAPGQWASVNRVELDYSGPSVDVVFGWAIKGDIRGLDPFPVSIKWENGGHVIDLPNVRGWALSDIVRLGPANNKRVVVDQAALTNFGLVMPPPSDYVTRGGDTVTLHQGTMDVWLWVSNYTKILAARGSLAQIPYSDYFAEIYFIDKQSTDADVFNLSGGIPSVGNLQYAYARG